MIGITQEKATEDRNKIIHTIMDEIDEGRLDGSAVDPDKILDGCLSFLDLLRSEGTVNMFGARPNLEGFAGLGENLTKTVHVYWMQTFGVVALTR